MTEQRGNWTSSAGFILAATGSAIGLGNLWKFPFITWENNGGAFVLVYLLCILTVGLPIMMAELLIGRKTQKSAVGRRVEGGRRAGLGDRRPLGRALWLHAPQLLHGDRRLVALLLRQDRGLDGRAASRSERRWVDVFTEQAASGGLQLGLCARLQPSRRSDRGVLRGPEAASRRSPGSSFPSSSAILAPPLLRVLRDGGLG